MARDQIDNQWWNAPDVPQDIVSKEGDAHWIWENIALHYGVNPLYDCVAIVSGDVYIEGAIAYQFDAKSVFDPGKGSLYVSWLASAPHNRKWVVDAPRYVGIGTVLLEWVLKESYNAGLGGRISLESLPTQATIGFYKNRGFVETGLTPSEPGLISYELPKKAANAWLIQLGELV